MNSGETAATSATAPPAAPPSTITPLNRPLSASATACRKSPSDVAEIVDDGRNAVHRLGRASSKSLAAFDGLALLRGLELLFQFLLMREQGLDFLFQFVHRRIDLARERLDELQFVVRLAVGFQAGHGFDAPDARRNGAFADDAEQANLARRARVRAAAKFHGITVQLRRPGRRFGRRARCRRICRRRIASRPCAIFTSA